jgi:hypothetical protein
LALVDKCRLRGSSSIYYSQFTTYYLLAHSLAPAFSRIEGGSSALHRALSITMETKFIRALVGLGIPGVALGIFYLLFKAFSFQFSQVDKSWTGVIVVLFLVIVGGITFYALHRWAPQRTHLVSALPQDIKHSKTFELKVGEEIVTCVEMLTSLSRDVVKVDAYTHRLGIMAEYEWLRQRYPNSERIVQSLTTLELVTKTGEYKPGRVHFDVLQIRLPDGREKEIFFDITSFFDGGATSFINKEEYFGRKLSELYSQD